jgi:putative membrane protein
MAQTLQVFALAFAIIAALIHVLIFALESVLWAKPAVWRRFGLKSQADADLMEPMAFNQGFYNLFLALGSIVGLLLLGWGNPVAGKWVLLVALISMTLASVVLLMTQRRMWRAALIQGVAPLLGIGFLLGAVVVHAPMTVI